MLEFLIILSIPCISDGEFHESKTRNKILCSKCGTQWGALMSFKSIDIPTLRVVNFKFIIKGGTSTYKKWKQFPFDIAEGSIFNLQELSSE